MHGPCRGAQLLVVLRLGIFLLWSWQTDQEETSGSRRTSLDQAAELLTGAQLVTSQCCCDPAGTSCHFPLPDRIKPRQPQTAQFGSTCKHKPHSGKFNVARTLLDRKEERNKWMSSMLMIAGNTAESRG